MVKEVALGGMRPSYRSRAGGSGGRKKHLGGRRRITRIRRDIYFSIFSGFKPNMCDKACVYLETYLKSEMV